MSTAHLTVAQASLLKRECAAFTFADARAALGGVPVIALTRQNLAGGIAADWERCGYTEGLPLTKLCWPEVSILAPGPSSDYGLALKAARHVGRVTYLSGLGQKAFAFTFTTGNDKITSTMITLVNHGWISQVQVSGPQAGGMCPADPPTVRRAEAAANIVNTAA